ncbi:MAG: 50S ribosomal protein L22 [Deltaproteobacteria bacterium]|nr:50S ribosomal protein L22 [Deltaproteobacteria bacterium]
MQATAKLRNLRMAPRKVRLLADMVRGKPVGAALSELQFSQKRAAKPVAKLIQSAVANATQADPNVDVDRLVISKIAVDGGPIAWKIMPRAMGRAYWISKRSSHVTVVVDDQAR